MPSSQTLLGQVLSILCVCALTVVAQSPTQTTLAPSWPTGTDAQGSSVHSQLDDNTTFYESNAIDGNLTTKWNDDTLGGYPDVLTISIPIEVTLAGIIILSGEDGWLLAYTVETSSLTNDSNWTTAAQIQNTTSPIQLINFLTPVIARQVRISVTKDQSALEYTRIFEVYPLFGTSSNASNSTADPSTSKKCSNTEAIAAGVIGGMVAIILAVLAGVFVLKRRGSQGGRELPEPKFEQYPQELALGDPRPGLNTHETAAEIGNTAYPATTLGPNHGATGGIGTVDFNKARQVHEKPAELPNRTSQNMETTSTTPT